MIPSFSLKNDSSLFAQYKQQLKKKENLKKKSTNTPNHSAQASPATGNGRTSTTSVTSTPGRTSSSINGSDQIQYASPITTHTTPNGSSSHQLSIDPASSISGTPFTTPLHSRSTSTVTPASHHTIHPRSRLTPEEINTKWKEIFSTMEKWTAEEGSQTATTPKSGNPTSPSSASRFVPCSYASAAAAQQTFESETVKYQQMLEGHQIQLQQHAQLVQASLAQQKNGLKKGERKIIVPVLPAPPAAPVPPPLTPYTPSIAAVDLEWRAALAADPSQLRGDALDHRALESRLMEFLHRENHPLTLIKEQFVANFLEAYSVLKNPTLKGCTTNQASDLLLSNTLPTLLYFLDLLTKLLMKLFPELEAHRNSNTMESIRQSCMESLFPSIFPTLFALYKRKYFFRDAELSSKMSVLASVGHGGCNITLEDMGVSKWLCLNEDLVEEERLKQFEKRRKKEREKRKALGETDEQAVKREAEEDRQRELNFTAASIASTETNNSSDSSSMSRGHGTASIASPPTIHRSNPAHALQLSPNDPIQRDSSEESLASMPFHPILQLTHSSSNGSIDIEPISDGTQSPLPPRHSPPPMDGSNGNDHSKSTPTTPHKSSSRSTYSQSPIRIIPTTRLSPVTDFEVGSLGRSPRAERIQDLLSRSPSRRTMSTNGLQLPSQSPTVSSLSKSKSFSRSGLSKSFGKSLSIQPNQGEAGEEDNSTSTDLTSSVPSLVRTPSPQANDAKKQVFGFSATGDPTPTTVPTPPPASNENTTNGTTTTTTSLISSPPTAQPAHSSLALALKQLRTPQINQATTETGSDQTNHLATSAAPVTPPKSNGTERLSKPRLGLAQTVVPKSSYLDSDSENDSDSSPRMPQMEGGMPILGSSMPMLQGLPSSMLTHTPGIGSQLLKDEKREMKKQKRHIQNDLTQHLPPQQPFVLNSSPSITIQNGFDTPSSTGGDLDDFGEEEEDSAFPYQEAVILLRRLTSERTPRDKLQCLIAVSQEVCWCVDRFYSRPIFTQTNFRPKPEDLCINADDLLSIVSFILIKSQLANVISEASFIDDFISRSMKLHMPGYFLATLQASIELITKLDKQKFLTRESIEQELRESANLAAGVATTNGEKQRRPSYLNQHNGTGALSSSLPRAQSKPMDTNHTHHNMHPTSNTNFVASSQPRHLVGIVHPSTVTLTAGQRIQPGAPVPSSRASGGGGVTTSPSSRATGAARSRTSLPSQPPTLLGASSRASSMDFSQSSADGLTLLPNQRSVSFHSSPGLRLDQAGPEALSSSNSWHEPFELKLEHFSNPSTPTQITSPAEVRQLTQQAMGQTRGM